MKKLMITAVAALCATIGFSEITSSNIVGYQAIATPAGYSMRAASFKAIEGNYKISAIKVDGDDIGYGDEYGQIVESDGSWGDTYYYLTEDSGAPANGWYKDMLGDEPVSDEDILTVGQAFFFSSSSDITLTYSGEVIIGKPTITVPSGYSMLGNPTPVTAQISDIEVVGEDIGYGDEYGQKVESDGSWGDTYYYLTEDSGAPANGWYKDMLGDEPVAESDVLSASDSLFFSSSAELVIKFPAAL